MGRLSLNPIKHIDLVGLLAILVAGIGWGKPAPFNPNNLRFRRWGTFFVAIAGPLMNVLLVAVFGYALVFLSPRYPANNLMILFFQSMTIMNATLALFNLLPIPPLDGSRLLGAILGHRHPIVLVLEQYGFYILIVMLVAGQSFISVWVSNGSKLLFRLLGL
jgi:Zn-dependent protease